MSAGDNVRPVPQGRPSRDGAGGEAADRGPRLVTDPDVTSGTGLILFPRAGALPAAWAGPVPAGGLEPGDAAALLQAVRPGPMPPQHGEGWFGRPGLAGYRLDAGGHPAAGRDWSPLFRPVRSGPEERRALDEAEDAVAGLRLVTEAEAVPGGAIRVRHTVTNTGCGWPCCGRPCCGRPLRGPAADGAPRGRRADRASRRPAACPTGGSGHRTSPPPPRWPA